MMHLLKIPFSRILYWVLSCLRQLKVSFDVLLVILCNFNVTFEIQHKDLNYRNFGGFCKILANYK